jgi:hypothetical protein
MRELVLDLTKILGTVCPTFHHVPQEVPYPHITLEPINSLYGLPWGPTIVTVTVKIWSRYAGTQEVLKLAKRVENIIYSYQKGSIKLMESALFHLKEEAIRVHTFRLKVKVATHE